jgi:DNA replication initiation complex subunit (GINS family)
MQNIDGNNLHPLNGSDPPETDHAEMIRQTWGALQDNEDSWNHLQRELQPIQEAFADRVMAFAKALRAGREHALTSARNTNPNQAFSTWLKAQNLQHMGGNDRAAYINIAENEAVALPILRQTKRRSIQLIWREEILPEVQRLAAESVLASTEKPNGEHRGHAEVAGDGEAEADDEPDADLFATQREPVAPVDADKARPITEAIHGLAVIIGAPQDIYDDSKREVVPFGVDAERFAVAMDAASEGERKQLLRHVQALHLWTGELVDRL